MGRSMALFLSLLFILFIASGCSGKSGNSPEADTPSIPEASKEEVADEIAAEPSEEPAEAPMEEPEGQSEDEPVAAAPKGTLYETEKFSIIAPDGWEVMEIDGGFRLYKSNLEFVQIHYAGFNQGESHARLQVEQMAKNDAATGPEEIEILEKTFWHTTYLNGNIDAGYYARIEEGGVMLVIQTMKGVYGENEEYSKIIDGVVFK